MFAKIEVYELHQVFTFIKKNPNLSLPKYVFFFNSCYCGKNCFQYFVNVY